MPFDLLETSLWGGRPIGLLRLSRGAIVRRYTTADRVISRGGEDYQPSSVARSGISDSMERQKNMVRITLPVDDPVAAWWRPYPPSGKVGVTWLATHGGDPETNVEWMGRVISPAFSDTILTLNCEPSGTTGRTRGQNLRWQRSCPLPLYSQGVGMCNVDKAAHQITVVVESVAGAVLTSPAFLTVPSGRLAGGFFEWTRPDGEPDRRSIMSHSGDTIVLNYGSDTLEDDMDAYAYPGCKHNIEDCHGYFDNRPNYGGEIFLPRKTPFDGNPI
jgi:hypothetical protein